MKKIFCSLGLMAMICIFSAAPLQAANLSVPSSYPTIQNAITASSDGDIIQIAAGTYTTGLLTVGKSLTFIGSGPASNPTTIIKSTANPIINLAVTGKSFTFQNLIIEGNVTNNGIRAGGSININSLTMQDVILRNCQVGLYLSENYPLAGPLTTTVSSLSMDNVTLTNNKFIGAYIGKTVLSGTVTNCTVTDNGYSSDLPNDWQKTGLQFVNFDEASVPHVTVTNSTFSNNGAGASNIERTGLIIYTAHNALSANEIMTVSGCSFTDHPLYAVRIKNGYNVGNTATVNGTFSGNYLDIWFNNIIGTTSSTTLVRNTVDGIKTVGAGATYDYNTIQKAIDASNAGGTVNVAAGTYIGPINITKSLSLKGANAGLNVIVREAFSDTESTIKGLVTVKASDVNINGFTLTNPGQTYAVAVYYAIQNINITYNIVDNVGSDTMGSTVHAINVYKGPDSVTIAHNRFNNIKAYSKSANAIGVIDTASADQSTGLLIEDNTFTNISSAQKGAYGVIINNKAGAPGAMIMDNTFALLKGDWTHAIGLEGPTPDAVVTGNIFSGLTSTKPEQAAIFFEDNSVGNTVTVSQNKFDGTDFYGVAVHPDDIIAFGYTVNAENNWWGAASGPAPYGAGALVGPNVTFIPWLSSFDATVGDVCAGAALEIRWLIADVEAINLKKSREKKLIHELDKSLKEVLQCDKKNADRGIEKFIKEVQKKKIAKHLTEDEVAALLQSANDILSLLGGL